MRILNEFNIFNKVIIFITNNESAMLVCERNIIMALDSEFFSITFSHYCYTMYVLNLDIKQGLELINSSVCKIYKLIIKIKNSIQICNELHLLCNVKKIKYLKSLLDVKIC